MTRRVWSWSSARQVFRLPAWAAAVAVAFLVGVVVGPIAVSAGPVHVSSRSGPPGTPPLKHVFVIMMENTAYDDLLSPSNTNTTFIQQLAANNGLATNYFGVTHVSLPNYIAATSGQTWGSNSDDVAQASLFNHQNLVDQLEAAGVSWKAYMENLPAPGDTVNITPDGLYVRKHDPFLMYPDVYNNKTRAAKVVPLTQLSTDLATGNVPQFVWITPNVCNDMHGMGGQPCPYPNAPNDANQQALYADGDNFLRTWVTAITHSKAWTGHSAIFITWDEGGFEASSPFGPIDLTPGPDSPILATPVTISSGSGGDLVGGTTYGGGHVPMIVVARGVGHRVDTSFADHYSLLQTIEQNFGLPLLGNAGDTVQVGNLGALLR
jgi:phosphatidylinositol-3-phosphatase